MELETLHQVVETVVNIFSIGFNSTLLYLITFHSTSGAPIYQYLLAVDAGLDLALSVVVITSQTVCLAGGGYEVFLSNGFLAGWWARFDMFMIWMWFVLLYLNIMWIGIQFVCRYAYLCVEDRLKRKRIVTANAIGGWSWGFFGFWVTYLMSHSPGKDVDEVMTMNDWVYRNKPIVVGSHLSSWLLRAHIFFWTGTCVMAIVIVIICEAKIKRHFDNVGKATHHRTRKMHTEFHRALLAMAITPLFTTTVPVLYYMLAAYMEWTPGPYQCFVTTACSSITMFNPLTTVSFMRCYRDAVLRAVGLKHARIGPTDTRVTGLSVATAIISHYDKASSVSAPLPCLELDGPPVNGGHKAASTKL